MVRATPNAAGVTIGIPPEGIKRQQISVAGHNNIGMAVHGQVQELVVIRVTEPDHPLGERRIRERRIRIPQKTYPVARPAMRREPSPVGRR